MNEEQSSRLLRAVSIVRICLIIIAACTLLITAYAGFAFWKYHLVELYSSDARFRKELVRAHQKGNYHEVVSLTRRKLESEPRNLWALFQLGSAQFNLGLWQESIDTMTQVIRYSPDMRERVEPFIERAKAKLEENETPQP